ncbi:hypothetical protein [Pseudoxanthomonas indica]|uniref:hypothetical protein n=1 Tax=Pseudoxanthomonas indica TaxID=428993 RepID=UPI0011165B65|nr:hypothetical protein [Pseudoxanthomonas indica]GGD51842.1 hypothetical protein GCM10007235_25080 [Pseudoxanthomonas indica]
MRRVVISVLLLLTSCNASGNELRRYPFKELIERSDVIVVATGTGRKKKGLSSSLNEVSRLEVKTAVKGEPKSIFDLITSGQFIELDVDCCEKGDSYLVFAQEAKSEMYAPTNGQFSVLRVKDGEVLNFLDFGTSESLDAIIESVRSSDCKIDFNVSGPE